jgi:hypothetical protein
MQKAITKNMKRLVLLLIFAVTLVLIALMVSFRSGLFFKPQMARCTKVANRVTTGSFDVLYLDEIRK